MMIDVGAPSGQLAVDGHDHLLVERQPSNAGRFFGRGPRGLPNWP